MFNKLNSNKGVFLTLIAYPIMIILVTFSLGTFVVAINENNHAKTSLQAMQAQYEAYKGIEFAFYEILAKSLTSQPFLTHNVSSAQADNGLLQGISGGASMTPALDNNPFENVDMTGSGDARVYTNIQGAERKGFEVKTYRMNQDIYILAKGKSDDIERLFISKISGISMYDYFFFFPGGTSFSDETLDANGGKIHANGPIQFGEKLVINNVKELTSTGGMYYPAPPRYMRPGQPDEGTTRYYRYPWYYPAGYSGSSPPADNSTGVYRNNPDGHYPGDKYGLYAVTSGGQIVSWNPADPMASTQRPISPSPIDDFAFSSVTSNGDGIVNLGENVPVLDTNGVQVTLGGTPINWYDAEDLSRIYSRNTVDPIPANNVACWDNNSACNSSLAKINGTYIPNRLLSGTYAPYEIGRYWVVANPTPMMKILVTNSEGGFFGTDPSVKSLNQGGWDSFIALKPSTETGNLGDSNYSITGLAGVVKAGTRTNGANNDPGAAYITPPKAAIEETIQKAVSGGMTIDYDPEVPGEFFVRINGLPHLGNSCTAAGINKVVFEKKAFMNHETGKRNDIVKVNVANLKACEAANPGQWAPANGIIYARFFHGVMLEDATELPTNGLTTVVKGNLYLKGPYNTTNWQPSSAVVSDYSYLLSNDFDYPDRLTVPQHHPNYPEAGTYDGSSIVLKGTEQPGFNPDYSNPGGVTGYNWQYNHERTNNPTKYMANRVAGTGAAAPGASDTGYNGVYNYNISLIGTRAYDPRYLERWDYYNNAGNNATPPSDSRKYKAVVTGSFIKLNPLIFAELHPIYFPQNARPCPAINEVSPLKIDLNGITTMTSSNFPCRTTNSAMDDFMPPSDLLYKAGKEAKKFENRYFTSTARPPGNFLGLQEGDIVELAISNDNWIRHNKIVFPSITILNTGQL